VDLRTTEGERDAARKEAEELRKEVEGLRVLEKELAELEAQRKAAADELLRVGGSLTNAEHAAERWRDEIDTLKTRIEQSTEMRHEAEKQLVEARAKLDAEQEMRREHNRRIEQLED